ncbi:hypothetical protein GIB67_028780 [Kingdonia uniflora]|uniref:Uncharacterized protein n=1 Tax=Kingdonia uniflora TaxID=39325 RepID=A0A7J7M250_9MAGN|nr:hypothetical protein GIB67_028780 [Kingdonia uniflora]
MESPRIREARKTLIASIRKESRPRPPSQHCCIRRVSKRLREIKEDAYVPEIISFGPLHRGKPSLKAMEEHKIWYFHDLMSRLPETFLEDMVRVIEKLKGDSRACYAEAINMSSEEFVRMMLFDGCFMIELFSRYRTRKPATKNDPIFNVYGMLETIRRDMLLLENQLPFIVLEHLFNIVNCYPFTNPPPFTSSVTPFLACSWEVQSLSSSKHTHALNLVRNHYLWHSQEYKIANLMEIIPIPCAWDLYQSGVKFRKSSSDDRCEITFTEDGVFEIPIIRFTDCDEVHYRNIIALEQCDKDCTHKFISYVYLLDLLINTEKDVRLLCDRGIIENYLGSHEELALVINKLCTNVLMKGSFYTELCTKVYAYHKRRRNRLRATLKRDYFNTPWKIIQVIAASLLLLLTFLQTLYTMK